MKTLIFLIYLPILIGFSTSETDNFEIENGKLIWQKVYETELTKEQLTDKIKNSGNFKNVELNESGIIAEITNLTLDFKGYGSSEMSTPMYIARNSVNSFVQIEFKESKYRVSIKHIKLTQNYDDALSSQGEMTDLEVFALKKRNTEFKSSFLKKPSKIINFTFENITEFKVKEKDKW
ncbi:hypothetical protein Celal_3320 [Cellulophaga algicola DSM 14237]|uniref:DUF4468 domain-containing protein n=1 Tax=Cellulophaga algicola (strain DSM 14237 / IC166 / ACAM 630) TaxID=688270 RepID=E6X627_CELAD|nr:hypothetical protein [Cellulophaga algicola]ADV50586.1 hypothetical protein Celal_3320 [Cellulophaga algicola DSM 14237]